MYLLNLIGQVFGFLLSLFVLKPFLGSREQRTEERKTPLRTASTAMAESSVQLGTALNGRNPTLSLGAKVLTKTILSHLSVWVGAAIEVDGISHSIQNINFLPVIVESMVVLWLVNKGLLRPTLDFKAKMIVLERTNRLLLTTVCCSWALVFLLGFSQPMFRSL